MAEYKHGSMDIKTQEKTFDGFMSIMTKVSVGLVIMLVLMAVFIR